MKNLSESINESLNESVLGIAGGIVAGLVGWRLLKGVINGLSAAYIKAVEQTYLPRMDALLDKYPKTKEWVLKNTFAGEKDDIRGVIDYSLGRLGGITLPKELKDATEKIGEPWDPKDWKEFEYLWDRCRGVMQKAHDEANEKLMKSLHLN